MQEKKLIVFDMDDTLIANIMWLDFNLAMGISEDRDYELYKQFKAREINYSQWTEQLQNEYRKGVTRGEIEKVLTSHKLNQGAGEAVRHATALGLETAVITGSFLITAEHLAAELGVRHVRANTECIFIPNTTEANVAQHFDRLESGGEEEMAKVRFLHELCSELQIQPNECIVVGDGANDIKLFKETGCGITFANADAATKTESKFVIDTLNDLPAVLDKIKAL